MKLHIGRGYAETFYFEISRNRFILMTRQITFDIIMKNIRVLSIYLNLYDRIDFIHLSRWYPS